MVKILVVDDDARNLRLLEGEREQRRAAQESAMALRTSEERFRALVEQSRTGIYVIQDEKFAYVNPRLVEMLGYTPDEPLAAMHANNYNECIDCILMR